MHEFGIFARSWLSADPNNPICDPNDPAYISDPNDPGYVSEQDKLRYYPGCDIDDDLDVDITDLALFVPEWLWIACWKQGQMNRFDNMQMMMSGGESALLLEPTGLRAETLTVSTAEPALRHEEVCDSAQRIDTISEILLFLREIEPEHPQVDNLRELEKHLLDEINRIQTSQNTLDFNALY